MIKIDCRRAPIEFSVLDQAERKRLIKLVHQWRVTDKLTPEIELKERAYSQILADSIPFD